MDPRDALRHSCYRAVHKTGRTVWKMATVVDRFKSTTLATVDVSWLIGVEFNAPLDTVYVISDAVFTANHLTDTDKQNITGKFR